MTAYADFGGEGRANVAVPLRSVLFSVRRFQRWLTPGWRLVATTLQPPLENGGNQTSTNGQTQLRFRWPLVPTKTQPSLRAYAISACPAFGAIVLPMANGWRVNGGAMA